MPDTRAQQPERVIDGLALRIERRPGRMRHMILHPARPQFHAALIRSGARYHPLHESSQEGPAIDGRFQFVVRYDMRFEQPLRRHDRQQRRRIQERALQFVRTKYPA